MVLEDVVYLKYCPVWDWIEIIKAGLMFSFYNKSRNGNGIGQSLEMVVDF